MADMADRNVERFARRAWVLIHNDWEYSDLAVRQVYLSLESAQAAHASVDDPENTSIEECELVE